MTYQKGFKIVVQRKQALWNVNPVFLILSFLAFWLMFQVYQNQFKTASPQIKRQLKADQSNLTTMTKISRNDNLSRNADKVNPNVRDQFKTNQENQTKHKNLVKVKTASSGQKINVAKPTPSRKIASWTEIQGEVSDIERVHIENQLEAEGLSDAMLDKEMQDASGE